ncbi:UNVERIFIED_CONTAM: Bidirectional sugar transporter SWEET1 [Sesamum angustifolium]|uniref:Bidirectional sugar transporter SWEET1 n=1 Tax=Sesamum angustifolium TaxID=2727405 RepID=A0AAW2L6B1_9LAMI
MFTFVENRITFKRIVKKRSTEQFSGIPYVMTLLNCLLSCWYGLPFVSPNNLLVSTINGTGAAIESVYVLIFLIFAPKKEKGKILGLLSLVLAVFATVVFVSLFALHGNARKLFCGIAATVFSIIIGDQDKESGIHAVLLVLVCILVWYIMVCLGLLGKDPFVAIPNGFGCGLGAVQLILYAIYRDNKGQNKKAAADGSLEMEKTNSKPHQEKPSNSLHSQDEQV